MGTDNWATISAGEWRRKAANTGIVMNPRVSIGLPVRNGQPFLREAVDSILAQTYQDFELIISDNASTDETEQICRAYAAKDRRIRYRRLAADIGSSRNFNAVFRLSRGEYFKWAAADDVLAPQCLARCVEVLDGDPKVVLAHPRAIDIDEFRKQFRRGTFRYDQADLSRPRPRERLRHMFLYASVYPIFGLIRSSVLKKTRLLRPHAGADYCLLVELLLRGKFAEVPEYLLGLRAHSQGYTCRVTHLLRHGGTQGGQEAKWWDPHWRGKVVMPHWKRLAEHLCSVLRSETSLPEKAAMVSLLCRVANWWREHLGKEVLHALRQMPRRTMLGQAPV
jgi:glycosyltransferase involved in cell wall biosynthesis